MKVKGAAAFRIAASLARSTELSEHRIAFLLKRR
jgi:hypothetical protein